MTHLKILFFKSSVNSKSLSRWHILMLSLPPLSKLKFQLDRNLIDLLLNFSTSCELFHQNTLWDKCVGPKCVVLSYQIHFHYLLLCWKHEIRFCHTDTIIKSNELLLLSAPKIPVEIFRESFNYKNAEPFH